jgi:hypothetical protein
MRRPPDAREGEQAQPVLMAATVRPTPAMHPSPRSHPWSALAVGLAAFVTGFGMFGVGLALPDSRIAAHRPHEPATNRATPVLFAALQPVTGAMRTGRLGSGLGRWPAADHQVATAESGGNGVDWSGPGILRSDALLTASLERSCRGTRADTSELTAAFRAADTRADLAAMAAWTRQPTWTASPTCWVAIPVYLLSVGDGDDRIASAFFGAREIP